MRYAIAAILLLSCAKQRELSDCEEMCAELIGTCDYAAFPSVESCVQGCTYNGDQGADVASELECILDAACDTFAIVECEHTYGVE